MGKLLDYAKSAAGEKSLFSSFGRWVLAVSGSGDQAAADIAALQAAQSREDWKDSVAVAITTALPAFTPAGNTITFNAPGALPPQDGVAIVTTDPPQRVLLAIGTDASNGIWNVIDSGGATSAVLERSSDADTSADVTSAMRVPVAEGGTDNGGKIFRLATNDQIALNTTALTFTKEQGLEDGTTEGQIWTWEGTAWTFVDPSLLNVQMFGAVGDGTTDDTAALQAAIDAVPQKGGRVFLPAGTYKVTSSLLLNAANRPIELGGAGVGEQIHGVPAGGGSVIVWGGAAAAPVLSVSGGATSVTMRDFGVDNGVTGAAAATHGIKVVNSSQFRAVNILMFPTYPFTTAGIELGVPGSDVSKAHIEDCYLRNCVVGLAVTNVIHAQITHAIIIDCTTCAVVGAPTATAYSTSFFGCTFEARNGQTGVRIVRGQSTSFYGCQFDAWDATHFGLEILSTAALADVVSIYGGRFTGNTVPYGMKVDFAAATVNVNGTFFSGFTTAGIKNLANKWLNIQGCHSDDATIPIVDVLTNGSVNMLSNDVAGVGVIPDIIGATAGVRVPTYVEFGGTLPTTGLFRFPKPSEQSTLAVFRREASAVDIPFIRVDVSSALRIGDVDSGAMPTLTLESSTDMYWRSGTFYWREAGGTIRHTITNAAASVWDIAASTSLDFKYNTTSRFKMDATGLGFNGVGPIARPVLATGAGKTVDEVITVLQNLGLVSQT